jgi:two-component system cell cycle response regulator DivK
LDAASGQAHILIVDDEVVTSALRVLFEAMDRRVSTASTLAETLEVARRDPAKLVLLDLTLPDGNGLTIVQPLLAAGCGYVVAHSGRDDPETRAKCLAAGCADVLVKPVPARLLVARTAEWLDS